MAKVAPDTSAPQPQTVARDETLEEVSVDELQEGDLITFMSKSSGGNFIGCFGTGISHIALVLRFDGKLYLAQAVPNPLTLKTKEKIPVAEGLPGRKYAGVHAADIQATLDTRFYSRVAVLRPTPPLTEGELGAMRARFSQLHGLPYESDMKQLLNSCTNWYALYHRARCATRQEWFCSELVADVLKKGGRLQHDNPDSPLRRLLGPCAHCGYGRHCCAAASAELSPEASEWMPDEIKWELPHTFLRLRGHAPTECTLCCCLQSQAYWCKLGYLSHQRSDHCC